MLTIAGRLDRWDALTRSEAARQRHSVAQVLTQLTFVYKPTLPGLLANKWAEAGVLCHGAQDAVGHQAARRTSRLVLNTGSAWYYLLLNKGL
jgi:hypothetical protein